jgi:hypothetical protein
MDSKCLAKCKCCENEYKIEYYKIGMKVNCLECNCKTEVEIINYGNSGYQITFQDLTRLLEFAPHRKIILPYIEKWFKCKGKIVNDAITFVKLFRKQLSLEYIHEAIQNNPSYQYTIYQETMTLWR